MPPGDWDDELDQGTAVVRLDMSQLMRKDRAFLIVLAGNGTGRMQKVEGDIVIGRSEDSSFQLIDEGISRKHAQIILVGQDAFIEDLGSTNGTLVNGQRITRRTPLRDGDRIQIGATSLLKFSFQDDLEEKFQREMYKAAIHDGLTGAHNKKTFITRLSAEIAFSLRHETLLTLLMMDLDHFKQVNDRYGHLAGDHVLQAVAGQIQKAIRAEDFFARYGGEEFALLCRGISVPQAHVLAERLRRTIESQPVTSGRHTLRVTASFGVAGMPDTRIQTGDDLIAAADRALYEAKQQGRNRVVAHPTG